MIMGGTFKTPVKEGLLNEDFVDQLRIQGEPSVSAFKTLTASSAGYFLLSANGEF